MPEWVLPATFIWLLAELRPVFSAPSYDNLVVLVAGWVHALGKRHISGVVRSAGALATKHFSAYYRFFSAGRWSLDELGLALFAVVLRLMRVDEVEVIIDDTLSRRSGKKVALGMMHADPVLRHNGKPFFSYGHVFVVLAVHVVSTKLATTTGWALPVLFRLFESSKRGGQKDAPSDHKRAANRQRQGVSPRRRCRLTDRKVVDEQLRWCEPEPDSGPLPQQVRPTKLQLAAEMVLLLAHRLSHLRIRVLADHAYNGRALLHTVHSNTDNTHFVVRGHGDAALYELPPAPTGKRGRPRTKGTRLLCPEKWAAAHPDAFETVTVSMYGRDVPLQVASYLGMPYRTLPGRLVRYVIVKDPHGHYRTSYLMSTDPNMSAVQGVTAYAHRWPLELTFQEAKQKLGMQDPQTQLPRSVRRTAPVALLVYSLVVCWYLACGHLEAQAFPSYKDPWYDKAGRPSFTDMLATLRRLGWAQSLLDPALQHTPRSKNLHEFLIRVAATA